MPVNFTLPPDTRAIGTGNPPQDMNGVADALTAIGAGLNVLNAAYTGGADPAGAADSTAAIQGALNAATPGQTVWLPAGEYKITAPVTIPPWVTLQGSGTVLNNSFLSDNCSTLAVASSFAQGGAAQKAAILIQDQATGGYSIASAGQQIININVDGSSAPSNVDGIDVYGTVGGVLMRDVCVQGMTGGGVQCLSRSGNIPDGLRLTGVMAAGGGGNGFFFQSADMICHDLHSIGNASDGFRIITAANSHFSDCRSGNNSARGWNFGNNAGSANASGYITLQNCNSQLNALDGYYVFWTAANGGQEIIATGLISLGDGQNGGSGGGGYAGLNVQFSTAPVLIDNFAVVPGSNNPNYAISLTNCAYLAVRSGALQASGSVFNNGGSNGTVVIDPGVLTGTGTTASPAWNAQPAQLDSPALPADQNLLAWNYDPVSCTTSTTLTSQTLYLCGIWVRSPMKVSKIWVAMTGTSGSGLTSSGIGLFNSAGTLLSSNTTTTNWTLNGVQSFTLSAAQNITPGFYWAGFFTNGGTSPTVRNSAAGVAVNAGITTAAADRFAVNGTGVTSIASITPSSNTTTGMQPFWAGMS